VTNWENLDATQQAELANSNGRYFVKSGRQARKMAA
jgi:hypothetical protein